MRMQQPFPEHSFPDILRNVWVLKSVGACKDESILLSAALSSPHIPVKALNIDAAVRCMQVVDELGQRMNWVLNRTSLHPFTGER